MRNYRIFNQIDRFLTISQRVSASYSTVTIFVLLFTWSFDGDGMKSNLGGKINKVVHLVVLPVEHDSNC